MCKVLGLTAKGVKQRLGDGVISNYLILDKFGRRQHVNFINEDGLYDVIFDSRKPEAKAFRKWVTSVVLPSIRKTGHYGVAPANPAPVSLEDFKQSLVATMQELVIKTVAETLKTYMPVVASTVKPVTPAKPKPAPANTWSLSEIADELDTNAEAVRRLLVSIHAIKSGRVIMPANLHMESEGYFVNTPLDAISPGKLIVTEKGRKLILTHWPTYKLQNATLPFILK